MRDTITTTSKLTGDAWTVEFFTAGTPHAIIRTTTAPFKGARVDGADGVADLQEQIMDGLGDSANEEEARRVLDAILAGRYAA